MGFAPALKGFERVAGGWHMIVMDAITDEFSLVDRPSASLYEPIKKKVVALHQQGYVHGDLRDTNLMVRKNGATEMMLFDFDWAGEIGKVRYPINVNRGPNLTRPGGAYDGELITADHDMEMLDIMFKVALSST
jgi:serine/threonine protein kinase